MPGINTTMSLTDRVSGTLQRVQNTMNRVHSVGTRVSSSIKAQARAMYDLARASDAASQKMNKLNKASAGANLIKGAITGATIAAAVATAKKAMSISDDYANMNARLNMINDGMQSTDELQKSIFTSAQRTGSAYTEMANGVAKMRMQAGDVFQNNGETIAFLETMNKSFVVGGASIEEQKSAMMQLTQAMASGKLQGDELRSLAETSPALIQAIATKLGVTRGEVKKLGADGKITADIVKTAMLEASESIDQQFRNMPMTWGRAWQNFINYVTKAFEPLSIKINQIANSAEFQQFASMVASAIQFVVNALIVLMDIIGAIWSKIAPVIKWIADNWSIIAPIVMAVAGAMLYYWATTNLVTFAMKALEMAISAVNAVMAMNPVSLIIMAIILLIGIIYAAINAFNQWAGTSISATGTIIGAVFALGMIVWNVLIFILNIVITILNAIIAVVFGLINFVIDVLFMLYQFILMIAVAILSVWDWIITAIINLAFELVFQFQTAWFNIAQGGRNMAVAIGGFISNMVNSVISMVEGMINGILNGINGMIGFLNGLGLNIGAVGTVSMNRVDFAGDIGGAIDSMQAPIKKTFDGLHLADGIVNHLESLGNAPALKAPQIGNLGYGDVGGAFNTGYEIGQGIDKAVGDMFSGSPGDVGNSFLGDNGSTPYELSPANNSAGGGDGKSHNPKGGHLDSVGKIKDSVKLDDEFIKLVQDVATMKWQQNFITLKPEIVTNIDSINSDREYGNMLDDLNATIVEAINNGADGLAY